MKKWINNIGPGPIIAAAFIGPGTVTVCTLAGVKFGYALLWAMLVSVFVTIILQLMVVRIGVVAQKDVSEVIKSEIKNPLFNVILIGLVLIAIFMGNAAYEAGNISGGILGLETLFGKLEWVMGNFTLNGYSLLIGFIAFIILRIGDYKFLERFFVTLVLLMSISFLITAILTKPDIIQMLKGMIIPTVTSENILTIIALVGTTVVPYNLFLHSSLVKEKWKSTSELSLAKSDTVVAILIGGLVSISIIISAAANQSIEVLNAVDLAESLKPFYGNLAKYLLSIGLFAAGITSAITAPLAAAYVVRGCLGWKTDRNDIRFKWVWGIVLLLGVIFSTVGFKPIEIIKFAQIANGLLLPVIAGILLWMVNQKSILKDHVNSKLQNVIGFIIVLFALFLGIKGILSVLKFI
ncbi:MAG: Nramp family divalent metal transporter [Polaribacter sp.]